MNACEVKFRKRVVDYILDGGKKVDAQKIFQIGKDTIFRWLNQYADTNGDLQPKKQTVFRDKKVSDEKLLAFVEKYPDATLKEIGTQFKIKESSVHYRLKKLEVTLKKKYRIQRKR